MKNWRWEEYYTKFRGTPPSDNLLKALNYFNNNVDTNLYAVDLGAGTGRDTIELLNRNWKVLATDAETEAISIMKEDIPVEYKLNLEIQQNKHIDVNFPKCDLVNASFSLFFTNKNDFKVTWKNIIRSLNPNGIIAFNLLGLNDGWNNRDDVIVHSHEEIQKLLSKLQVLNFEEVEKDGEVANGNKKHWHYYSIITKMST